MAARTRREEADLIVVGASVGGLAAAVIAADRGCRRASSSSARRSSAAARRRSPSASRPPGSRFQRAAGHRRTTAERLADDLVAAARRSRRAATSPRALAAQGAPLVAWLADRCGVDDRARSAEHRPPGTRRPRLHAPGDHGGAEPRRRARRAPRPGIRTSASAPGAVVEQLVRDDAGAVTRRRRCTADRRGAPQAHRRARAARLRRLRRRRRAGRRALPGASPPCRTSARRAATGDGLRLGLEAGAPTRRLGGRAS